MATAFSAAAAVGGAVTKGVSFYKMGRAVYDYLSKLHVQNVNMTVKFKRKDETYVVTFEAVNDSHWSQGFRLYPSYETEKREDPDVFKIIELECTVKEVAERVFDKFIDGGKLGQKEVINYFKNFADLFKDDYFIEYEGSCIHQQPRLYSPDDAPCVREYTTYTWKGTYRIGKLLRLLPK